MDPVWMDFILRLGFPIVVVLAMVRGYLVPGFIYERVVKENERLTQISEDKVIPLAIEGQRVLREALAIIESRKAEEFVVCPSCSRINWSSEIVCVNCHNPLPTSVGQQSLPSKRPDAP